MQKLELTYLRYLLSVTLWRTGLCVPLIAFPSNCIFSPKLFRTLNFSSSCRSSSSLLSSASLRLTSSIAGPCCEVDSDQTTDSHYLSIGKATRVICMRANFTVGRGTLSTIFFRSSSRSWPEGIMICGMISAELAHISPVFSVSSFASFFE